MVVRAGTLLPERIPPQTTPLLMPDPSGQMTLMDTNWWLFFYNIALQVLSNASGTVPITAGDLLTIDDVDVVSADYQQAYRQALNAALQISDPQAGPSPLSVTNALLTALDNLLPDSAARAQPVSSVTVTASPFTYVAPFNGTVSVTGGTVSLISIVRQGTTVATGLTAGIVPVSRLDSVVITYSGTPTVKYLPT